MCNCLRQRGREKERERERGYKEHYKRTSMISNQWIMYLRQVAFNLRSVHAHSSVHNTSRSIERTTHPPSIFPLITFCRSRSSSLPSRFAPFYTSRQLWWRKIELIAAQNPGDLWVKRASYGHVHCVASSQSCYFVNHFWNSPLAVGLTLCGPINNHIFRKKT